MRTRDGPFSMDFSPTTWRGRACELLLFDVDGVLTDGRLLIDSDGREAEAVPHPRRHRRWSGRDRRVCSPASCRRAPRRRRPSARASSASPIVRQGADDKLRAYRRAPRRARPDRRRRRLHGRRCARSAGAAPRRACPRAPSDAVPDVLARVHWTSSRRGGDGAARELIEHVLRAQGCWTELVARYAGGGSR